MVWAGAGVVLLLAGFLPVWRQRQRSARRSQSVAVSRARSAITLAEASQNACPADDPAADALLSEARALVSDTADPSTARRAERLATEADAAWRGHQHAEPDA